MNNIELIVNDEVVDLYNDTSISLNLQSQDFNQLSEKQSSFSRSFVIPKTDKNNRLFQNVFTFNVIDDFAYNYINATLKINGVEFGKGNVIVENDGVGYEELRITFYFDASPFFQLVSNTNLLECDFKGFDHYYNFENIVNSMDNARDYIYPLIDYTADATKFPSTSSSSTIDINTLLPAIKVPAIIKAIENKIGYRFKGDVFLLQEYLTSIIPFSKSTFRRDKYFGRRYNFKSWNNAVQNVTSPTYYKPLLTEEIGFGDLNVESLSIVPFSQYYNQTFYYPPPDASTQILIPNLTLEHLMFSDKVRLKLKLSCIYDVIPNDSTLNILINHLNHTSHSITASLVEVGSGLVINPSIDAYFSNQIPSGTYQLNYEAEITTSPHNEFFFEFVSDRIGNTITKLMFESIYISDEGTTDVDRNIKLVTPDNIYDWLPTLNYYKGTTSTGYDCDWVWYNGVLSYAIADSLNNPPPDPSKWLGDLPAFQNAYCIWSASIVTAGAIVPDITIGAFIKHLTQLFNCMIIVDEDNREVELFQLKELYDNLNQSKDWTKKLVNIRESQWNTRATSYGQTSILKFSNEDSAGEIGLGRFNVADKTLAESKVVIELPYSATLDVIRWDNNQSNIAISLIRRIDDKYKITGADKICICNTFKFIGTQQDSLYELIYRKKDGYEYYSTLGNQFVAFSRAYPKGITFDVALNSYYRYLKYLIDNYKELTCFMLLSPNDIANINYRIPIYLEQFSSNFFIQRINDWSEGKPTKVELLKLN
jgi:hypothetical protein